MNERERRSLNRSRANQDEGDIARYERYRYGGGNRATPQYNDIGSTWSIEQLVNEPDDIDGTLIHTPQEQAEVIDVTSQPKRNWESDDRSRGDPLEFGVKSNKS